MFFLISCFFHLLLLFFFLKNRFLRTLVFSSSTTHSYRVPLAQLLRADAESALTHCIFLNFMFEYLLFVFLFCFSLCFFSIK